jgi:Glycosyl transferase family 2
VAIRDVARGADALTRSDIDIAGLVTAALAGDSVAWDTLVDQFAGVVWAEARSHGLSFAQATDVSQLTWLRLADHLECVTPPEQIGTWLTETARREGRRVLASSTGMVSVVIPTRNRASLLAGAIASVLGSPLMKCPEQIIVVDDDSHDQTEQVARRFGVRYVRVAHRNAGRSRNAGLALADTTYVAFLDDDDVWLPGNMQAQLAALEAHPKAAFAYGIAQGAAEDLQPLPWTFPSPPLISGIAPEQLHLAYPQVGVVLFRRETLVEVGGFDGRILYGEDGDLMIRIAAQHDIVGVEVVGVLFRQRAPSKARSDYHWARREVTRWKPKHVGVGWRTSVQFRLRHRGLFCRRFIEDGAACVDLRHRQDALACLCRALWVSPPHALRHPRTLVSILSGCVGAR